MATIWWEEYESGHYTAWSVAVKLNPHRFGELKMVFNSLSTTKVINPQAGWYRGDFHVHSNFSEGVIPIDMLVEIAKSEGMDFFVLTDHNTIDNMPELILDSELLIIPGLEVTFLTGHFNVFGIEGWHDWIESICVYPYIIEHHREDNLPSMTEIMIRTSRKGMVNCIVHPMLDPWEWREHQTNLNYVHCIEICNCPGWMDNEATTLKAIELWTELLNAGYRMTALGGSDYHKPGLMPNYREPERIGYPTTYVYAEELSWNAILSTVLRRRVYVSLGPKVSFQACAGSKVYNIGQDIGLFEGKIEFSSTITECPEAASAQIVKNGEVITKEKVTGGGTQISHGEKATPAQSTWYRLDVYDSDGAMLAITNPIFVGPRKHPQIQTYGEVLNLAFPEHDPAS